MLLGAPTLKLRGDYLAIVTLGFGEIIRIFLNNLSQPVNITNGPQGITRSTRSDRRLRFAHRDVRGLRSAARSSTTTCCSRWLLVVIVVNLRLQNSRIGRAWEAIREDEIAARAMGINTRNMKLLAFAMGATFGGVAGGMFSAIQGFICPESFVLVESIMVVSMVVLGGMGNIWGVILGALLLSFVPEILRWTVDAGAGGAVRPHAGRARGDPHAAVRPGAGADDAVPARRAAALRGAQARARGARRREPRDSLLEAERIAKRFGGVQALTDVSLHDPRRARSTA